jgi:hypothetical protein
LVSPLQPAKCQFASTTAVSVTVLDEKFHPADPPLHATAPLPRE